MTVWKHLLNMLFLLLCPHCWCNHQSCILFYYALASVASCVFYQGILWKEYCSAVLPSDIMMIWPWNTIQLWICEAVDLLLVVYLHSCHFSTCLWLATWRCKVWNMIFVSFLFGFLFCKHWISSPRSQKVVQFLLYFWTCNLWKKYGCSRLMPLNCLQAITLNLFGLCGLFWGEFLLLECLICQLQVNVGWWCWP